MRRLLFMAAILLGVSGGQAVAEKQALQVLAKIGPWPALSALISYRGRVWFTNSVRYPDHNSADIYSLDPATGNHRYERHLFSQDVGQPVVADGLLYWPYEDPRPSMGWGHIAVTNGHEWQLRVMHGAARMFHVHAMEKLGGRIFAAPSAWRAGLHVSNDGGQHWKQIYDHPTPKGHITRIISLAAFDGKLFGAVVHRRNGAPNYPLLMLDGETVTEIPDWPATFRTNELIAGKKGVYGLVRDGGKAAFWRTDGRTAERVSDQTMPDLRAVAADGKGFWGASDNALWRSDDGKNWRRAQDLTGGKPIDMVIHRGRVFIGGVGDDGRGILWGPPPSPSLSMPAGAAPAWTPRPPGKAINWETARENLNDIIVRPDQYRTGLRDLAYSHAMAGPPPGFFETALRSSFPDRQIGLFGGRFKRPAGNLGRHILLWGMGVAGRGRVPGALLDRPWTQKPNRPQKWFDSLPMALFAVNWTRQRDRETLARLIARLDRPDDPLWLKGDVIGALSAASGKGFGYDFDAWRQWWAKQRQ
jgi:hypothetical protein